MTYEEEEAKRIARVLEKRYLMLRKEAFDNFFLSLKEKNQVAVQDLLDEYAAICKALSEEL